MFKSTFINVSLRFYMLVTLSNILNLFVTSRVIDAIYNFLVHSNNFNVEVLYLQLHNRSL
jgi:hypothetical protein